MSSIFVFNQYYIDLLKKLKIVSKKHKESSNTAKSVLKSIRENYSTFDKTSNEYITFINSNISHEIWDSYLNLEEINYDDWINNNGGLIIFKDITLADIAKLLRDDFLCHHYLSVYYIFKNELSEELLEKIVKVLQNFDTLDVIDDSITDENYRKILIRLNSLKTDNIKSKTGIDMNSLKDTTIGKIAKEIIDDVDVSKLQKSLSEEGDIFKAIAKPDSGFSELFTNVSQKMASKISSGELSQENIIKDAMKFASVLPNFFNNGSEGGIPNNNNMMNMMKMMSSMMNNSNDDEEEPNMNDLFKKMATKKGTKSSINKNAINKMAKIKQMKDKLEKRRKEKD